MLEFEKPQRGIELDLTGLSEQEAIELVMRSNETAPPHPSTINLGCGPEPKPINLATVYVGVLALLSAPAGKPLSDINIELAKRTGAWFYWCYAGKLAEKELNETLGRDAAIEVMYGDGRSRYHALRADKLRWVFRERFGVELS
ncbi:MAG: hypothetical protein HYX89_07125 [Chloroflexi bacterium]|nr:hypothetical protein [Chloroflexota bacterium]